jgi:hypothetical protein
VGLDKADIKTLLARGTIDGVPVATQKILRDKCQAVADADGKLWVINKNGDPMAFDPKKYADIVYQTANAEAVNIATLETLAAKSIFYVRIIGSNSQRFCTNFRHKVYYTGPGDDPAGLYPHIRLLPRGGAPFHVQCTKRYIAFIPRLATEKQTQKSKPDLKSVQHHGQSPQQAEKTYQQQNKSARKSTPRKPADDTTISSAESTRANAPEQESGQPAGRDVFLPELQHEADRVALLLTDREKQSASRYQSKGLGKTAGYADVNNWLRFRKTPLRGQPWVDEVVSGLDSAMSKGTLPISVPTFRAMRGNNQLIQEWQDALDNDLPWLERAFYSTATDANVAPAFWGKSKRKVLFVVIFPSGTKAAFPAAASGKYAEQLEIVIPRGQNFRIVSINVVDDVTIVKAEVIR